MRDIKLYLKDILSSSNAIIAFIEGMEYEEFCKDDKTVSAVIKKLEIIGEAAKKIPHEITSANSGIPWKEMAGMTRGLHMSPTPLKGSKAHSVCSFRRI